MIFNRSESRVLISLTVGHLVDLEPLDGGGDEPRHVRVDVVDVVELVGEGVPSQCCQMAKFDPFLSLDCARVEGVGAQSKERKGSNFAA